jgi:AAA domain
MSDEAASPLAHATASWRTALDEPSADALGQLVRALRSEATLAALVGPPGAGKSAVLHALPQRLGRSFACVHLPDPTLRLDEIRAWIESFGDPLPADAGTTLEDLVYAQGRRGAGLVLMIDDANAMSLDVASALDDLVRRTDRALRIVLAGLDDERLASVLAAFRAPATRVELASSGRQDLPRAPAPAHVAPPPLARPTADSVPPAALPRRPVPAYDWRTRAIAALAGLGFAAALGFAMGRWTAPAAPEASRTAPDVPPVAAAPVEAPRADDLVSVHINAKPWARVAVDGRDLGITPLGDVPLELGTRRFRAELPDGRVIERDVNVGPETRRVTFP